MAIGLEGPIRRAALVVSDPAALVDGRSGRPRRVSKKIKQAIRGLLDGKYRTQSAAAIGESLSGDYLQRALHKPHVLSYIDVQVQKMLQSGKLRATGRLLELIDSKSDHVSFDASLATLGINGIRPVEAPSTHIVNNVNVAAGYVIDLSEPAPVVIEQAAVPAATAHNAPSAIESYHDSSGNTVETHQSSRTVRFDAGANGITPR